VIAAKGILRIRGDGSGYIALGVRSTCLPAGDYALRLVLPVNSDMAGSEVATGDLHTLDRTVMPGATVDDILTSDWHPKKSDAPKLINWWGLQKIQSWVLRDDAPIGGGD